MDAKEGLLLRLRDILKIYIMGGQEVRALDGVDLDVNVGEFVSIMGPSGSGKSTMMNMIGCLDVPTSGSYQIDGAEVSDLDDDELASIRNRKIGFVFQGFNLIARTSALENVELPLLYGRQKDRRAAATAALVRVGLGDRLDHTSSELSGGQQQRVAIARAIVSKPRLILADEPTGNLDSVSAADVLRLMDELHEAGSTLVLITHDTEVASASGRVLGIRDGLLTENDDRYMESIR